MVIRHTAKERDFMRWAMEEYGVLVYRYRYVKEGGGYRLTIPVFYEDVRGITMECDTLDAVREVLSQPLPTVEDVKAGRVPIRR